MLFDCILGNSSSGIIEAPLLKKQVINIGDRQKGRYRFGSVINVGSDYNEMREVVKNVLDSCINAKNEKFNFSEINKNISPSSRIIDILKTSFLEK